MNNHCTVVHPRTHRKRQICLAVRNEDAHRKLCIKQIDHCMETAGHKGPHMSQYGHIWINKAKRKDDAESYMEMM